MLQSLSQNLLKIIDKIKGRAFITEEDIDITAREIRIALLSSDVSLSTIKFLIENIKLKANGQEVLKSITPGQMIVKIIHDELIAILSNDPNEHLLKFSLPKCNNFLIVGLQGSGKTTNSAKLALFLKKQHNKNVLLVSLDTYRPAAQEQLEILAKKINIDSLEIIPGQNAIQIAQRAIDFSRARGYDIVIYDTAGRLHVDDEMMAELSDLKIMLQPEEIILVVDSLIGQDAVNIAQKFNQALDITGSIFTRMDGDQKGGALLTIKHVTGRPIKFLSVGEKPEELEQFYPERIVSRILDMGDVVSLVEKAAEVMDQQEIEKSMAKLKKGKFTLNDYASHLKSMNKMGGIANIMSMIPGINKLKQSMGEDSMEKGAKILMRQLAMISSMTKKERVLPEIIKGSRKKRIATGSGNSIQDVNKLLNQFEQVKEVMKKLAVDPKGLMRGLMGKFF
jgi:signal recognition particle subunit SRP54